MSRSFRRLASVAAATTVAGVLVPVVAASSAFAAEATSLTVSPTSQYVGVANTGTATGTATYTVTLNPASSTAATGVSYDVFSGPDTNAGAPFTGTPCTATNPGTSYTCSIGYNSTEGTDQIHFYVPAAAGAAYTGGSVHVDGTLVKGGPATSYTITPTSETVATATCASYVVSGKDADGNPASGGVPVTVSQTLPGTTAVGAAGDPMVRACIPSNTAFPAPAAPGAGTETATPGGTTAAPTTTFSSTDSGDFTFPADNGTSTAPTTPGSVTIGVASNIAGTLNVSAGNSVPPSTTSGGVNPATATTTVDAGNPATPTAGQSQQTANNDVAASLTVTPTTATVFPGGTVEETATVKNAQGDLLGGVQVTGQVTGSTGVTTSGPVITDQTGTATFTETATATATGTATFTAFVEQDKNGANNATGPNAGEPQATSTITVSNPTVAGGAMTNLTSNCDTPCQQATTTTSKAITFTFKDDSGKPVAGATVTYNTTGSTATVTATPASPLTTDANGQATVTVTATAPTNGQTIKVNASVPAFGTGMASTDTATVQFATAGAVTALTLEPYTNAAVVGGKTTVVATAVDGFGNPVSGAAIQFSVNGRNTPANNLGATGACTTGADGTCTFTFTDNGSTLGTATRDTITATSGSGTSAVTATADVNYYADATAKNVGLTIVQTAGASAQTCPGTATTDTATTSAANGAFDTVCITVTNAGTTSLNGKAVTVSTSGVGGFVTSTGAPISGNTVTVPVDDGVANAGSRPAGAQTGYAKVYVRSGTAGTETITATADSVSATGTVTYNNSEFQSITPERVLDTRTGQGGIQGPLAPNTNYTFDLSRTDVPADATAYSFNVTAILPSGAGNLRIGPAFNGTPTTSLINYQPRQTTANAIVIPNTFTTTTAGPPPTTTVNNNGGLFALYSAGSSVNVAIDVDGYYVNDAFHALAGGPTRVADTRTGGMTIPANTSRAFTIPTSAVPAGSKAVAINVTAVNPGGVGNLRIYPDGATTPPATSNINYVAGVDKAAFAIVNLPADGKIDVYSAGSSVNVAIDVFGYYIPTSTIATQNPVRIYDSRTAGGELLANMPRNITVAGTGTGTGLVPADAQAVLVSLTGIHAPDSTGVGNLRAYPAGSGSPFVSTLNYAGKTVDVANFAIVPVGTGGQITLFSAGSNVHVAVDILGYVPAGS